MNIRQPGRAVDCWKRTLSNALKSVSKQSKFVLFCCAQVELPLHPLFSPSPLPPPSSSHLCLLPCLPDSLSSSCYILPPSPFTSPPTYIPCCPSPLPFCHPNSLSPPHPFPLSFTTQGRIQEQERPPLPCPAKGIALLVSTLVILHSCSFGP